MKYFSLVITITNHHPGANICALQTFTEGKILNFCTICCVSCSSYSPISFPTAFPIAVAVQERRLAQYQVVFLEKNKTVHYPHLMIGQKTRKPHKNGFEEPNSRLFQQWRKYFHPFLFIFQTYSSLQAITLFHIILQSLHKD